MKVLLTSPSACAAAALTDRSFSNLGRGCFPPGPPKPQVFRGQAGRTDEVSWIGIEKDGEEGRRKEGKEGGK